MKKRYMSGSTGGRWFNRKKRQSIVPAIRRDMLKAHAKSAHKGKVSPDCPACKELSENIILQ